MEKCPKCGYQETLNWRPRFADVDSDSVYATEIPDLDSELKPGEGLRDGQWYVYKTRTGRYLVRMLQAEFEVRQGTRSLKGLGKNKGFKKLMAKINRRRVERGAMHKFLAAENSSVHKVEPNERRLSEK